MQALGVDIQTIQSIVGHADTEMPKALFLHKQDPAHGGNVGHADTEMTEHDLHVQESIRQSAVQLFSEAFSA